MTKIAEWGEDEETPAFEGMSGSFCSRTEEERHRDVADCVFRDRRRRAVDRHAGDYSGGDPVGQWRGRAGRFRCSGFDSADLQRGLCGDEPARGECRRLLCLPGAGIGTQLWRGRCVRRRGFLHHHAGGGVCAVWILRHGDSQPAAFAGGAVGTRTARWPLLWCSFWACANST
jgi:hypothetical protein